MTRARRIRRGLLWHDFLLIAVSVVIAWWLVRNGVIALIFDQTKNFLIVGSFVAGLFFTSVFTIAPAIVMFGELAQENGHLLTMAIIGGLGAAIGDLVLFRFVRDRFMEDLSAAVGKVRLRHTLHVLRFSPVRWLFAFAGAAIIASPLPDELGLMLMGVAKMPTVLFIPLVFAMNAVGIFLIGAVARGL